MDKLYDNIMEEKRNIQKNDIRNKVKIEKIMRRMERRIMKKINKDVRNFSVSVMNCTHTISDEKLNNYIKASEQLAVKLYRDGIKNIYVEHNLYIEDNCEDAGSDDEYGCSRCGITVYEIPPITTKYNQYIDEIYNHMMEYVSQFIENNIKNSLYVDKSRHYNSNYYSFNYSEYNKELVPLELARVDKYELRDIFAISRMYCIDTLASYGFYAIIEYNHDMTYIKITNIFEAWNNICLQSDCDF